MANEEMIAKAYELGEKSIIDFRKLFIPSDDDVPCAWFHYDWDKQLREGKGHYAVEAFRESAKALALDTPIRTTEGFKTIGDIKIGDYVYGDNGLPTQVLDMSPIYTDHDCYKVTLAEEQSFVCDGGHRWKVKRFGKVGYDILTTEEMTKYPVLQDGRFTGFYVPLANEVHFGENLENIQEYIDAFDYGASPIPREVLDSSIESRLFYLKAIIDKSKAFSFESKNDVHTRYAKFFFYDMVVGESYFELIASLGMKPIYDKFARRSPGRIDSNHIGFRVTGRLAKEFPEAILKPTLERNQVDMNRGIVKIEKVDNVPVKCLFVDNDSHLFLIGRGYVPTHNTQYVIRGFCLYRLVYPVREQSYIVIVKANQTEASKKLKEISTEFQTNPWLKGNLIKINEDNGRAFDVVVSDKTGQPVNVRIEGYGKGSSIRGISYFDKRPHIIICDDLQDLADSQSDTIQVDDWEWFNSDVLFLGRKTRIFMIGNNLGASCLIERVAENAKRLNFTFNRIPILNDEEKSNWEELWPTPEILEERENHREMGNISGWMREKMCLAVAPEKQIFKKEYYKYYNPKDIKLGELSVYTTVDVASSQNDRADFTSVVTIGVASNNYWFVLDVDYGRYNPTEQLEAVFKAVAKWRPIKVGIEKVAYQASFEHYLYKEMPKRNMFFTIQALDFGKKKELRIEMLQPRFFTGSVWFPYEAKWLSELCLELETFPRGLHDDLIDALAYHEQIAAPPVGGWTDVGEDKYNIPIAGAI